MSSFSEQEILINYFGLIKAKKSYLLNHAVEEWYGASSNEYFRLSKATGVHADIPYATTHQQKPRDFFSQYFLLTIQIYSLSISSGIVFWDNLGVIT